MDAYELSEVSAQRQTTGRLYLEFLRVPALSLGLYELSVGAADPQKPHTEAEVYYVAAGRAIITVDLEDRPVGPGSLIFVAAGVPHRFHTITESLQILVFFAPAEYSQARA